MSFYSRSTAGKSALINKSEAGIRKKKDILIEKAKEEFLTACKGIIRPNTYRSYETALKNMAGHFRGKKLGEISPFLIEAWNKKRKEDAP